MIVNSPIINNTTVYYQTNTRNKSFTDMIDYLTRIGVENNKFFCILFDPDLYNVDPFDPRLNVLMKKKIANECITNYWYFLREVIRIPDQGSTTGGKPFRLDRGNLALNFCLIRNYNIFLELPRQFGKTISICCRILWVFLYGTTNSETVLINKKHDDSKLNLRRIKDIRDALPEYLQMKDNYGVSGGKVKAKDNVTSMTNTINNNSITTLASARNRIQAQSLGRGCSQPIQWYDEYAFTPYNDEIYLSATPAYSAASKNAKANGAPYGILISTTPGDLTTDCGMEAYTTKELATKFSEKWYDYNMTELTELLSKNTSSKFIHIRFTYKQLGAGEEYLAQMILDLKKNWAAIRREVLLEWAEATDNSPFTKEDLDTVRNLTKEPIGVIKLCKYFEMEVYEPIDLRKYPPIIGVDVSGGVKRDASAITVIDSRTTKVAAALNCNFISPNELAACILELVTLYAPSAVVNIERNGGFGASIIGKLKDTPIRNNLYYEIKDKVIEERYNGFAVEKKKVKTKVYGLDSTKNVRDELMEILRQRMTYHKDKFISPIIHKELTTLEVKKSGKVEHTSSGHDDQLFSYLMALYVWYNGKDLMNTWGIQKTTLKTDENVTEEVIDVEDQYNDIDISEKVGYGDALYDAGHTDVVKDQLNFMESNKTYTQADWYAKQFLNDEKELFKLLNTPLGRKAYCDKYGVTDDEISMMIGGESQLDQTAFSFTTEEEEMQAIADRLSVDEPKFYDSSLF